MSSPQSDSSAGKGPRGDQTPKPPPRQHGPGGGGPAGALARPTEKAKDFRGTLRRIVGMLRPERARIVVVLLLAAVSVTLSVLGPKILGSATTKLFEGVMAQIAGKPYAPMADLVRAVVRAPNTSTPGSAPREGTIFSTSVSGFTRATASTSASSVTPCCCSSASTY